MEKNIKKGIFFNALQWEGDIFFQYRTDDPRLAGHCIPPDVKDPEKYLEGMTLFLDTLKKNEGGESSNIQIISNLSNEIVGASKANDMADAANFKVWPVRKKCFYNREGAELVDDSYFECLFQINGGIRQGLSVPTSKIGDLVKIIKKKFPAAIISADQPKIVERRIENEFREKTAYAAIDQIYVDAGWQMIDGKIVYLHSDVILGGNRFVQTRLRLPCTYENAENPELIATMMLKIYEDPGIAISLLLVSLLGILFKPFELSGHPPRFLLFLNGRTGSFKTSLGKVLYTQLSDDSYRETPRRIDMDTETSFERGVIASGQDTTLLFDDYSPAKTPQKRRNMQNKLETLIRMAGDGSTKSRSNSDLEDVRGSGVKGMIIVTGELRGRGISSNLRCLYLEIQGRLVNLEVLSWFQENSCAYTTFLNTFAEYVGENWELILSFIKNQFSNERNILGKRLKERRMVDIAATLNITADILVGFLGRYGGEVQRNNIQQIGQAKELIAQVVQKSASLTTDEAYSVIFLKTIHDLMQIGKITLYSRKPESMAVLESMAGYYDSDSYYFYLPSFYSVFLAHLRSTNRYYPLDPDELATELLQDGISVPSINGKDRQGKPRFYKYQRIQLIKGGQKINFIKIRKGTFQAVIEGISLEEINNNKNM